MFLGLCHQYFGHLQASTGESSFSLCHLFFPDLGGLNQQPQKTLCHLLLPDHAPEIVPSTWLLSCTGLKARPMECEVDAEGKGKGKGKRGKGEVKERRGEGKGRKAKEMKGKDTKRKEQERTGKGRAGKGEVKQRKHNSQCGSALSFVPSIIFLTLLGGGNSLPTQGSNRKWKGFTGTSQRKPKGTTRNTNSNHQEIKWFQQEITRHQQEIHSHEWTQQGIHRKSKGWMACAINSERTPILLPTERKNLVPSIFWWPRSPKSLPIKNLVPSTPPEMGPKKCPEVPSTRPPVLSELCHSLFFGVEILRQVKMPIV